LISIAIHILTIPLIDLLRHFLRYSISVTCIFLDHLLLFVEGVVGGVSFYEDRRTEKGYLEGERSLNSVK